MIYISTLLVLFILILFFDLKNKEGEYVIVETTTEQGKTHKTDTLKYFLKSKKLSRRVFWFWSMFTWFTLVSGLAYNVGSDIVDYMNDYDDFAMFWRHHTFLDIFDYGNRQPGWVLLNAVCAMICPNFLFIKLIIAIFVNLSVFRFIRKNTNFWFICLFIYAVTLYLNLNFNALRQALAVACFLWGYNYLIEKKYIKYLLWAFGAFMFHSSALICLALPLLYLIKINKWTLFLLGMTMFFGTIYVLKRGDIDQIAFNFIMEMNLDGNLGENITMLGERYTGDKAAKSSSMNLFGIILVLLNLCIILFVMLFNIKHNKRWLNINSTVLVLYAMMVVLDFTIPVLFFRFMFYFQFIYFIALTDCLVLLPRRYLSKFRYAFTVLLLAFYTIEPIKTLFAENEATGLPLLVQFYPYHSVIDHQIDPVRKAHFGSHR